LQYSSSASGCPDLLSPQHGGTTAFLFTRQQVYQADGKLLVTTAGGSLPVSEVTREDESRFYATQIDIIKSQTMLQPRPTADAKDRGRSSGKTWSI